ncbi:MAG: phospholipase D-like domain-containing protein [Bdellovibrionota bacterium]
MHWFTHHLVAVGSFSLTLLFVSFVLRERRPAGSMMAWLIVIAFIPYVGIPLYLLLSSRKFPTRLMRKAKLNRLKGFDETPAQLSRARRILLACGMPEAKPNRSLELLATGVVAYDRLLSLIRASKKSIFITTFIFGDDDVGRSIVSALAERATAGVDVRLLVDSLGAIMLRHPSFRSFSQAGGKIAYFMPIFHIPSYGRTNLRNHRKLAIFDEETAVLGGMNLAKEYLGPTADPTRWIDLALEVRGDSVSDLAAIFQSDWSYAKHELSPPVRSLPLHRNSGEARLAQVVPSGPDVVGDPLYDVLLSAIHAANERILIVSPYIVPDESLAKAIELAAKRKVKVRILTPLHSNHLLADVARGSYLRQFAGAGAEIYFYPKMIHAKAVLIDHSLALLGSLNFDMRSLLINYELGFFIYDEATIEAVFRWAEPLMAESSREVSRQNFWRDLIEGAGRVIGPVL